MALLLLALAACNSHPCAVDELLDENGECVPLEAEGPEWQKLPDACEDATDLAEDPLFELGSYSLSNDVNRFVELVDLELAGDRVFGVGQGGLMAYDISNPNDVDFMGYYPQNTGYARYHRVELIDATTLAVSHREEGVEIVDVSDPTAMETLATIPGDGWEGMLYDQGILYIAERDGGVLSYDVSDPENPQSIGSSGSLATPWEFSTLTSAGWAYIADNSLGVIPVDLNDPGSPSVGTPLSLGMTTLHVSVAGQYAYVSNGGSGLTVLSLDDPAVPSAVGSVTTGGSVVMSSVSDGILWVVDHEGVMSFDLANPAQPVPIGREVTDQFALAVRGDGERAWVGDWNILSGWETRPDAKAPQLELPSDEVSLSVDGGDREITLSNRGGGTLKIAGATVDDDRITLKTKTRTLEPGQSTILRVDFEGGEGLDATVCISANDPDAPTRELKLTSGQQGDYLGQPAPDFTLNDLDGNSYTLSDYLGQPIFFTWFATW